MFLEIILAGFVAYSAHSSANNAADRVSKEIANSTAYLDKKISQVGQKIDNLSIKIDRNQLELMNALTWHDYIQTLHIKGAKYKGDNLYILKEKKTTVTTNLVTREIQEVNGKFKLYKSFNERTEHLYYDNQLIYERFSNGETKAYYGNGEVHVHTDVNGNTYTYLENGLKESVRWSDGALWIYKYNVRGEVVEIESHDLKPTSKKPVQPSVETAYVKWQKCMQHNSMTLCMAKCRSTTGYMISNAMYNNAGENSCINECQEARYEACGSKPEMPM